MKLLSKQGQVTPFIIVGVLIVIISGALLFVNRESISTRQVTNVQVEPIRNYIEECVNERVEWKLDDLRKKGGKDRLYNVIGYPFLQNNILYSGSITLPTLSSTEEEFSRFIENYLKLGGCNLDDFKSNFDILEQTGDIFVKVKFQQNIEEFGIFSDKVDVFVNFPIVVKRGDFSSQISNFNFIIDDYFGKYHFVAERLLDLYDSDSISSFSSYCSNQWGGDIKCSEDDSYSGFLLLRIIKSNEEYLEGKGFEFLIEKK